MIKGLQSFANLSTIVTPDGPTRADEESIIEERDETIEEL